MKIEKLFTNEFDLNQFTYFLSELFNKEISIPYDITFLSKKNDSKINRLLEYKKYTDLEEEELKVFIIECDDIINCKKERDELIKKFILKSYINNALSVTFSNNSSNWIITYYKVRYEKNNNKIDRKISVNSKYSYTINENPNEKFINEINNIIKKSTFSINSLYEIFNNDKITDINKL